MPKRNSIIIILFCCLLACSTYVNPPFPTPTAAPSDEPAVTITPTLTSSATYAPTQTATPTPSEQTSEDLALAALCWVECRGMEEQRPNCCASVVDTVYTRIDARQMSDGTVFGTLRWGCTEDAIACQFQAYVTNGCAGIASPCPFDDSEGMDYFADVVASYSSGELQPVCSNFLYYDLRAEDTECSIEAENGQFVNFRGLYDPSAIKTPTPIAGTPGIIEVTPLGGDWGWANAKIETATGTYTPYGNMNVRWGPGTDYDRRYVLSAGQTVRFYAWVSELPFEAWLCLDEPLGEGIGVLCTEAVALTIDHVEYGKVVFDD